MPEPVIPKIAFDTHGGPDGVSRVKFDFSVNSNPFGPAPELLIALAQTPIYTYPDPTCCAVRRLAAAHHAVTPDQVCFGGGAADLIDRLSRCYLDKTRSVLVAGPSFGEYARATHLCGAKVSYCQPYEMPKPDVDMMLEAIWERKPTLVWLCHPNNPTGHAWTSEDLQRLAAACLENDCLLALDLAYLDFLPKSKTQLPSLKNVVQLYSLTKSFRMPGIRIGYIVASQAVTQTLASVAPPWRVSAHALAAAEWALTEPGQAFLRRTLPRLSDLRREFQKDLRALGLHIHATETNYFLLEVNEAASVKEAALKDGFRMRDCSSFGLPSTLRLAAQLPEANQALVTWFRESTE